MLFGRRERKMKRLLIVEDEPLVAFDNEHFLTDLGYDIVGTVDNAKAACAMIADGGIDLILSDVTLSRGSSGRDVALAAKDADIPVLFVTASCPIDAPALSVGCLAKPYTQRALKLAIEAVEAHLSGGPPKRAVRGLRLY
ncbi:MAG: response regulator [Rhizorhabdus sp.]|nr:response regulator [Rhizorhabdus sp.]